MDYLIKETYEDFIYLSLNAKKFKVVREGQKVPEGFVKVNTLRKFWSKEDGGFDAYLRNMILLNKEC